MLYFSLQGSILERHHFATARSVLHETGIFDHLDSAVVKRIYFLMEELILATDMTRHAGYMTQLNSLKIENEDSQVVL